MIKLPKIFTLLSLLTLISIFLIIFFSSSTKATASCTDTVNLNLNVTKHCPLLGDQISIPSTTTTTDNIYYIQKTNPNPPDGNLTITSTIQTNNHTAIVFIEGNLTIGPMTTGSTLEHSDSNSGIVFVVSGNVNIDQSVTQIDAVIISSGIICTAYNTTTGSCLDGTVVTPQLTINGSIISLNQSPDTPDTRCPGNTCPLKFVRNLADNSCPTCAAEEIVYNPKYLVLLRNLFSDTLQKWSEIDPSTAVATPVPFTCSQYSVTSTDTTQLLIDEKNKLCALSGCKNCPSTNTCVASGSGC